MGILYPTICPANFLTCVGLKLQFVYDHSQSFSYPGNCKKVIFVSKICLNGLRDIDGVTNLAELFVAGGLMLQPWSTFVLISRSGSANSHVVGACDTDPVFHLLIVEIHKSHTQLVDRCCKIIIVACQLFPCHIEKDYLLRFVSDFIRTKINIETFKPLFPLLGQAGRVTEGRVLRPCLQILSVAIYILCYALDTQNNNHAFLDTS